MVVKEWVHFDDAEPSTVACHPACAVKYLATCERAWFVGACARRGRRIDNVDIESPEDVVASLKARQDSLDCTDRAELMELGSRQLRQSNLLKELERGRKVEVAYANLDRVAHADTGQLQGLDACRSTG